MGGSGGRYFSSFSPSEFQQKIRDAETADKNTEFEGQINDLINDYLAKVNDRDVGAINKILDKIKAELSDQLEGSVDLLFGGSVAKHTYVDGLSDVDALLLLKDSASKELSPREIKEVCAERLKEIFGRDSVWVGDLAVTVRSGDLEIQLLPAVRSGEHFKIGNSDGVTWDKIRPRVFAEKLSKQNSELGGKLVPSIKLIKSTIAQLPDNQKISGYHAEALALRIFSEYKGDLTPRAMLKHFFQSSQNHILKPIPDVTGQSDHVDAYLGAEDSLQRKLAANAFDRIWRRMRNADGAKDANAWKQILGDK